MRLRSRRISAIHVCRSGAEVARAVAEHRAHVLRQPVEELVAVRRVGEHRDRVVEARQPGDAAGDAQQLGRSRAPPRRTASTVTSTSPVVPVHESCTPGRDREHRRSRRTPPPTAAVTTSTCSAWETSMISATLTRWRRLSGWPPANSVSIRRTSAGSWAIDEAAGPKTTTATPSSARNGPGHGREHLPHLRVDEQHDGEQQQQRDRRARAWRR